jgi:hypothetical protein
MGSRFKFQKAGVMSNRYAKDLRGVDRDDPAYWEEILRRESLTMDAGRNAKICYVGNSKNLEDICEKVIGGTEGPKPS